MRKFFFAVSVYIAIHIRLKAQAMMNIGVGKNKSQVYSRREKMYRDEQESFEADIEHLLFLS